jgi:DNA-binding transcriptional LysR family regulator
VLADLGLAIASEWMFASELESKTVKPVLVDWLLPPVEAWAIFPAGRQASAKARAFASFIEAKCRSAELAPSGRDNNSSWIEPALKNPRRQYRLGSGV